MYELENQKYKFTNKRRLRNENIQIIKTPIVYLSKKAIQKNSTNGKKKQLYINSNSISD